MMTVRARLLGMAAAWWLKERKNPAKPVSRLKMRCMWFDADINRHMNNSRYLALMDVGRYHYVLVSGILKDIILGLKWVPVVGDIEISYKRSIKPGDRFELETYQVEAGRKSATLLQRFWLGDTLAAEARVTILFLKQGKVQELEPLHDRFAYLMSSGSHHPA